MQTIESDQSLLCRAVVVLWADQLPAGFSDRTEDDAKLMYVALTRAEDHLVVTFSAPPRVRRSSNREFDTFLAERATLGRPLTQSDRGIRAFSRYISPTCE